MIDVKPYHPDHLKLIDPHEIFDNETDIDERMSTITIERDTKAYTLFRDGQVMAIVGGTLYWEGVMEMWSYSSKLVMKYPKSYIKALKRLITIHEIGYKLRRVQINVPKRFENTCKWAKLLGFKREATLERFGPGGVDHELYVRFP